MAAIQDSQNHGYPPFEGTASFREAITRWYHRRYGVSLDPDGEALPLLGSKEGIVHLALAYINPGDTVLVPTPAYPAHFRGPAIAGANIIDLPLSAENDWLIDLVPFQTLWPNEPRCCFSTIPATPLRPPPPANF
jgi:LL-diaminopimelate aminotransferase